MSKGNGSIGCRSTCGVQTAHGQIISSIDRYISCRTENRTSGNIQRPLNCGISRVSLGRVYQNVSCNPRCRNRFGCNGICGGSTKGKGKQVVKSDHPKAGTSAHVSSQLEASSGGNRKILAFRGATYNIARDKNIS